MSKIKNLKLKKRKVQHAILQRKKKDQRWVNNVNWTNQKYCSYYDSFKPSRFLYIEIFDVLLIIKSNSFLYLLSYQNDTNHIHWHISLWVFFVKICNNFNILASIIFIAILVYKLFVLKFSMTLTKVKATTNFTKKINKLMW